MTRIEYAIILEGPPEHVWPARKDLQAHIDALAQEMQKTPGLVVSSEWVADKTGNGGSNVMKIARLAGRGAKAGLDFLFKDEEKPE